MNASEAAKQLRTRMQFSQHMFADVCHLSIRAIAFYESGRMPSLMALLRFERVARRYGHDDLVVVFQKRLEEELGE